MIKKFNVRVYGLLISNAQLLVTDEFEFGFPFTKLPGGGLEFGESTIDCLKREFMEECTMEIEVLRHFYTTDFFVESAFGGGQLLSIYYLVKPVHPFALKLMQQRFDFDEEVEKAQIFRWAAINEQTVAEMTFPVDKHVVNLLVNAI